MLHRPMLHRRIYKKVGKKYQKVLSSIYYPAIRLRNTIKNKIKHGTTDFFTDITIETNSACNRRCSYCPNSTFERGLVENQKLMDEQLFKKIIDELVALKFDGRISPTFYGEPLLDPRIVELMGYAKKRLPKCHIRMHTNGDYMTVDLYNRLFDAGVDVFVISQHSPQMTTNIKELLAYLEEHPKRNRVIYNVLYNRQEMSNRGGLVEEPEVLMKPRCSFPDNPMIITCKGDIVLCCNDYNSSVIMGNLGIQSLVDIWNSKKYAGMRQHIFRDKNYTLEICKKCVGQA